jgi:hypothetical protein
MADRLLLLKQLPSGGWSRIAADWKIRPCPGELADDAAGN